VCTTDRPVDRGVRAPELLRHGLRFFAAPQGQPRARRGTDVLLLVPSLLGLAGVVAAYPPGRFESSLARFLAAIPGWLDPVWGFLADSLWLWAVALVAVSLVRRRFEVAFQALAGFACAAAAGLVVVRLVAGSWPDVAGSILGTTEGPWLPHVRAAGAVAVILVISPHLVRPLRTLSNRIVLLGALGVAIVGGGTPAGSAGAFLIAVASARPSGALAWRTCGWGLRSSAWRRPRSRRRSVRWQACSTCAGST
jgi:hypothetical protein